MALKNCPECNRPVSTAAAACPGCGFPVQSPISSRESFLGASQANVGVLNSQPGIQTASRELLPEPSASGSPLDLHHMQLLANYRGVQKSRSGGFGSIAFGVVAVALGVHGLQFNVINAVLAVIGVLLVVDGVWLISNPTPKAILFDGCATCIVGTWNILIGLSNSVADGSDWNFYLAVLGLAQIGWGIQSFRRYARFAEWPPTEPSVDEMRWIEQIVSEVRTATMAHDFNVIDVTVNTFPFEQQWKCKFAQTSAVFLRVSGPEVIFAASGCVKLTKCRAAGAFNKSLTGRLTVAEHRFNVTLTPQAIERLERWTAGGLNDLGVIAPLIIAPAGSLPKFFWWSILLPFLGLAPIGLILAIMGFRDARLENIDVGWSVLAVGVATALTVMEFAFIYSN